MKEYPNIELKWREVGLLFQVQFVKSDFTPIVDEDVDEGVDKGVNEGANGANKGVNLKGEEQLYWIIKNNKGLKVPQLMELIKKSQTTVERYIRSLKKSDKIEFIGADKTGGYYVKK
ncbi:MAG: hypothetical protein R3Y04_04635 [Rikenellaceae bacterium]